MQRFGKWMGSAMLVLLIAVALFLTFAPGYVERFRNAVTAHDPYPVSPQT